MYGLATHTADEATGVISTHVLWMYWHASAGGRP